MTHDKLAQLYRRHGPLIYARCRRILADSTLAEDAVQEVFVRIYPYLARPIAEEELQYLALRISTHYCLDVIRRRTVEARINPGLSPAATNDPLAALTDRNTLLQLFRAIPDELRAPALLHHLDGLSQEKIAKVLSISPRTVFTRLKAFHALVLKLRRQEEESAYAAPSRLGAA